MTLLKQIQDMLKRIVIIFLIWKAILFATVFIAPRFLMLQTQSIGEKLFLGTPKYIWVWANFDGVNYISVAHFGYWWPNFAFFPLFPLLISLTNKIFSIPYIESGLWVSHIALLLSLFFLYKTILIDFDKNIARRAMVMLLLFPVSFYLVSVYADSLFLFLSIASFYFARKSRWFLSGFFGFFASLTRLVGLVLLPVLLLEWLLQKNYQLPITNYQLLFKTFFKEKVFFLFLIPLAIITYGLYLQINFGDFLFFQKAMVHWNQAKTVLPLQTLFRYLKIFLTADKSIVYFIAVLEFIATFAYLALAVYVTKKIRISYGIFMLGVFLLPTFTGTFQSMPRYILHTFPAFIALSLLTSSSKIFKIVAVGFILLQIILVALFTRGYFVA